MASFSLLTKLPKLPGCVAQCSVHPNLPILALISTDRTVHLFSLLTFSALDSTIPASHAHPVRSVGFKPSSSAALEVVLTTGSSDGTVGFWRHYSSGISSWSGRVGPVWTSNRAHDHCGGGCDSEFEDDEDEWRFSMDVKGHDGEVKGVCWNAFGNKVATWSGDRTVVWEELGGDEFKTLAILEDGDCAAVVWHPTEDLSLLASVCDRKIRLYEGDSKDWTCIAAIEYQSSAVGCLDFEKRRPTKSNPHMHSGCCSHTHPHNKKTPKGLSKPASDGFNARMVCGSDGGVLRIWHRNTQGWEVQAVLPQTRSAIVKSVTWSAISGRIAACGADGRVVVYEERKVSPGANHNDGGKSEWVLIAETEGEPKMGYVLWSTRWDKEGKDGDEILIGTCRDGIVQIYRVD